MNIPAHYDSELDFFNELNKNQVCRKTYQSYNIINLAFIILDNPKIPWTWYKQIMMQYLWFQMMGGITGGNGSHKMYFATDIVEGFKKAKKDGYTHAMMCQIGMLLDNFANQETYFTPIQHFYKFSQTNEFMRAHIIAKPDKEATIHSQHIELNLTQWDGSNFLKLGSSYERSEENFHDDYTPHWIKVDRYPIIKNFTENQRKTKWFLYPEKEYDIQEQRFYNFFCNNGIHYPSKIFDYAAKSFAKSIYYYKNTEKILVKIDKKFDIIIVPTAGIFLEHAFKNYAHENTKFFVYDYDPMFLKIKKKMVNYGMTMEESFDFLKLKYPQKLIESKKNTDRAYDHNSKFHSDDEIVSIRESMSDCDIEYIQSNFMEDDFEWMQFKGKSVFIDISNIFLYVRCWHMYNYHVIKSQYVKLINKLEKSSDYFISGKTLFEWYENYSS